MRHFFITIAGVLVALILFAVITPFVLIGLVVAAAKPAPPPARSVLVLDLRGGLTDQDGRGPLAALSGESLSVMGIEQGLRRAENDPRVRGLFVRLPEGGLPPAAADELRAAFLRFRDHGKPILAHSQGLYASGVVVSTYELAAASGDLWMQPASSFQVTGIDRPEMFFKRAFDKYGVTADYQQRYQYKTAVNPYLYSDYTPAHRESDLSWMGSVYGVALADAAHDRGLAPAAMQRLIQAGPWSAEQARDRHLIDQVGQVEAAQDDILAKAGDGAKLLDFSAYASGAGGAVIATGPVIAVISAEGDIMTGPDAPASPLGGATVIRSDAVAKAFHAAIADDDVKAIVFRVSSPGGSDTASEQILAAVRAAKAAGKPVVVSMGTYAASGGYWISSQASEIVAQPTTLTGSIGVFGGKFVIGPALARFGVDLRDLKVGGDYADAFEGAAPMTASQKAAFSGWMDRIYEGFVGRVAQGRRLSPDRVRDIAKGRVWTGQQALGLGLVDHLGGFYDAAARAKALAGISGEARLESFDVHTSPLEALQHMFGASQAATRVLAGLATLAEAPAARSVIGEVDAARLRAQGATVLAPGLGP